MSENQQQDSAAPQVAAAEDAAADQEVDQEELDTGIVSEQSAERTGHPAVDEVLDSLDRLDQRPPDEHVEVYESAHEALRGALAEAREEPRDPEA